MSFLSSAKIQLQNTNTSSKHSVPICNGQFGCYFLFWMEIATSWAHLQLQEKRIQILLLFRIPFYSVIKEYPQIQIVDCFGFFFFGFSFCLLFTVPMNPTFFFFLNVGSAPTDTVLGSWSKWLPAPFPHLFSLRQKIYFQCHRHILGLQENWLKGGLEL